MTKADITPELVARLLEAQFPEWANLPISAVDLDGWDNTTLRLGDSMSVRLPSADMYSAAVDKEHRWLAVLASHLPVAIPQPLARGAPSGDFPRPWSIYRWLPGEHASVGRIAVLAQFAGELAGFLNALSRIDARDGPPAGQHNFFRGGPLATFDAQTRRSIAFLADEIDAAAASEVWEAAAATHWRSAPVWVHGDVSPSNLLVVDGRLSAVIDFGTAAVGDPACDLVIAWTFFSGEDRNVFRACLPLDAATWARGRGWALWKALITRVEARRNVNARTPHDVRSQLRFGWRRASAEVIGEVIEDHQRHG